MANNITQYPYYIFPPLPNVIIPGIGNPGELEPTKIPPIAEPGNLRKIIPPPIKDPGNLRKIIPPPIKDPDPVTLEYDPNPQTEPGALSLSDTFKHLKWTDLLDLITGTSISQIDLDNLKLADLGVGFGAVTTGLATVKNATSLLRKGADVKLSSHSDKSYGHILGNRSMGDRKRANEAEEELKRGQEITEGKYGLGMDPSRYFEESEVNKIFTGDPTATEIDKYYPETLPQTKTSTEFEQLRKIHSEIESDLVLNKYLMVSIIPSEGDRVEFPFVVDDFVYSPESNLAALNILGRNLQKYHFTSSEDTLEMRILWNQRFSFPGKQPNELLINRALRIASFSKKTNRKVSTVSFNIKSRIDDIVLKSFPIFDPSWNYVLIKSPIKILETHYSNGKVSSDHYNNLTVDERSNYLDVQKRQASGDLIPMKFEQTLILKRVSQTDISGKLIYAAQS